MLLEERGEVWTWEGRELSSSPLTPLQQHFYRRLYLMAKVMTGIREYPLDHSVVVFVGR